MVFPIKCSKIVILNYNGIKDLQECIKSIPNSFAHPEIVIIDNGSSGSEFPKIKELIKGYDNITLFKNNKNLGFAGGYNAYFNSLPFEDDEYIFLLNNDTALDTDFFNSIESCLSGIKEPSMVSCKMVNYWDRKFMDNAGHKMLSSGEIIPIGHAKPVESYKMPFENIGACAGAALYSTKMLIDIGLFDEYFDTGYEDAELGLRAFIAGYKCVFNPDLIVFHKMGQSIKDIFNYEYTLKIQTNIFYTCLKLVHWQVLAINIIPFILRFIVITIIDLIFWRPRYLKVQYHALFNILFKDFKKVLDARKESKRFRRIPWWMLLMKQEFFLKRDIINFYRFILKGEKSYFEKY